MIDFMVVALPRSGTAWLANLLTVPGLARCRHEALSEKTLAELDEEASEHAEHFGIADTSLLLLKDLDAHPALKLVVHRNPADVNGSLAKLGLPPTPPELERRLVRVRGFHVSFAELFDAEVMDRAFGFLFGEGIEFDRHRELCKLNVQNVALIERVRGLLAERDA